MNIEVKLQKKRATYKAQDGTERKTYNLYLKVGTEYIPIEVVYFPNAKCEGRDPSFSIRRAILEAIAEPLPDKGQNQSSRGASAAQAPHQGETQTESKMKEGVDNA